MDFVEQYVQMRFRLWTNKSNLWIVYEHFPEEGPDVSKKIRSFHNQAEAEEWLEQHQAIYAKWVKSFMAISLTSPATAPPSGLTTTLALKKAKEKLNQASRPKSSNTSASSQKESTSLGVLKLRAQQVKVGDYVTYRSYDPFTVVSIAIDDFKVILSRKDADDPIIIPEMDFVFVERP